MKILKLPKHFSGGVPCRNWAVHLQLMAGALILAFLIITKVYGCVFTALVATPIYRPLINSVYDIKNIPDIHVYVERDLAVDIVFRVGLYRSPHIKKT